MLLLPELSLQHQTELIRLLKEQNVETNIGTWHMPMTTYFRTRYGYCPGDFPVTDDVFNRSLTLPLYETLLSADQEIVAQTLLKLLTLLDCP